jgi:hypothetical protein
VFFRRIAVSYVFPTMSHSGGTEADGFGRLLRARNPRFASSGFLEWAPNASLLSFARRPCTHPAGKAGAVRP